MASTGRLVRRGLPKEVATIGLDLAKTSVHFVDLDASGKVLTRRQCSKAELVEVSAKLDSCRIGMEACCGAHHLRHQLLAQGHDVRLMPPKYVQPFVKRDKGKVERPIRYVRQSFFFGREFVNDADLNAQVEQWLAQTANGRRHGTTGERPQERFERDERRTLGPLASSPYRRMGTRTRAATLARLPEPVAVERRPLRVYAEMVR